MLKQCLWLFEKIHHFYKFLIYQLNACFVMMVSMIKSKGV